MIAQRIRELRKAMHMTQTEFGKAIGLSQGYLTSIESGKRNVTERTILAICRCFLVNRDWLCDGRGDMFAPQRNDLVLAMAEAYQLDALEQTALKAFLQLSSGDRHGVLSFLRSFSQALDAAYEDKRVELLQTMAEPYAARNGGTIDGNDLDKLDS